MSENWRRYLCEYRHDGSTWSVEVIASSFDDASRRLRAVGMTGQVKGEIAFKIPLTVRLPPTVTLALIALGAAAFATLAVAFFAGLHQ